MSAHDPLDGGKKVLAARSDGEVRGNLANALVLSQRECNSLHASFVGALADPIEENETRVSRGRVAKFLHPLVDLAEHCLVLGSPLFPAHVNHGHFDLRLLSLVALLRLGLGRTRGSLKSKTSLGRGKLWGTRRNQPPQSWMLHRQGIGDTGWWRSGGWSKNPIG